MSSVEDRMDYAVREAVLIQATRAFPAACAPGGSQHRCDNCGTEADCYNPLDPVLLK